MSELLSSQIIAKLRSAADTQARPKERHGTLNRLEEACGDIASGRARVIIKSGLPDAEMHYRRSPTLIKPPRIEEYVLARRAMDVKAKRIPSIWTGPTAATIRKDVSLLEYVRVREQEQAAVRPGKIANSAERLLEQVEDLGARTELRFLLARARRCEQDIQRLKEGLRSMRPSLDIDALMAGRIEGLQAPSIQAFAREDVNVSLAVNAILRLTDTTFLSKCGLELDAEFGNVVERRTRVELISSDELSALRALTGLVQRQEPSR